MDCPACDTRLMQHRQQDGHHCRRCQRTWTPEGNQSHDTPRKRSPEMVAAVLALPVSAHPRVLMPFVAAVVSAAVHDLNEWSTAWTSTTPIKRPKLQDVFRRALLADAWLTDDERSTRHLSITECTEALDMDLERFRSRLYAELDNAALQVLWRGELPETMATDHERNEVTDFHLCPAT